MSSADVMKLLVAATEALGGVHEFSLVLLNEASAYPHGSVTPQTVRKGSVVLVDTGCSVQGYQSDISRTWVIGEPTSRQREVWNTVKRGQELALETAKIGVPVGAIDKAVRAFYEGRGWSKDYGLPGTSHRTGHGIGMDGHEPPYLVRSDTTPLEAGMCFSDEPGIYIPGEFGVRMEDCWYMSVIDLTGASPQVVGAPVPVGVEPRGIAITPNGTYAFIANHTVGEVTIVQLSTLTVVRSIKTGGNPYSIAITNDGDRNDRDERVFVTRLFSELIDPARPDGFDDAKQGVIDSFRVGAAVDGNAQVSQLLLKPLASGFAADRRPFCLNTRKALQDAGKAVFFNSGAAANLDGASQLAQPTFCPDVNSTDASDAGPIAKTPQKVYPNMLRNRSSRLHPRRSRF